MPNRDGTPPPAGLDLRIEELESLLKESGREPAPAHADIPVLDEEVPAASEPVPPAADPRLSPRQLVELGQRLQQRVDSELDDLAEVIRSVVKRCILEELRKELPPAGGAAPANPDKTETP